ncbi:MAG: hypothetical protein K2L04_00020 [Alistipes sp.]|nr:hypothetical protein [Alistipes sp.]
MNRFFATLRMTRMTVDSLALRTLRYIAFACLSGLREMTWRGYSSAAAGAGRIEDAGRRRWQRKALQAILRPASSVEKLFSLSVIREELKELTELYSVQRREKLQTLAKLPPRHCEASQMPWRSAQKQRPGGYDSSKDGLFYLGCSVLFRLPRSLYSFAMTGRMTLCTLR